MFKLRRTRSQSHRKTVLIVDDDPQVGEALQRRLASYPWDVLTAADGQEALEIATRHKPDLLLLDIKMPRMNGHAVLENLRNTPGMADVPVLMLTLSESISDITKAAAYGIQAYITKPFYPGHVIAQVERVLGSESC